MNIKIFYMLYSLSRFVLLWTRKLHISFSFFSSVLFFFLLFSESLKWVFTEVVFQNNAIFSFISSCIKIIRNVIFKINVAERIVVSFTIRSLINGNYYFLALFNLFKLRCERQHANVFLSFLSANQLVICNCWLGTIDVFCHWKILKPLL